MYSGGCYANINCNRELKIKEMKSDKLALLGGSKTIKEPFKPYNPYGLEEINAAKSVIETGILSQYLAKWGDDFLGGPMVKKFEADWEKKFNDKACNYNKFVDFRFSLCCRSFRS